MSDVDSPVLCAREVEVRYPRGGSEPAVAAASLDVFPRSSIGIVGESGSGKTTLARALVGWVAPTKGHVAVFGRSWSEVARSSPIRRRVQMIFQDPYGSLNPHLTAREAVAE